jgi:hypothetical protein
MIYPYIKSALGCQQELSPPNPDLETGTLFPSGHCESCQKRDKVRACALKRSGAQAWQSHCEGEIASVLSQ